MLFKRNKIRVVPAAEYTDYTERFEALDKMREESKYATRKDVMIMGAVPIAGAIGLFGYSKATTQAEPSTVIEAVPAVYQPPQVIPDVTSLPDTYSAIAVTASPPAEQTGVIADATLEILAAALDPVIELMVAISLPIASVIMIGACFFFMFGNTERAWTTIMNAGLGYIIIQLSPLFLKILKAVGEAV